MIGSILDIRYTDADLKKQITQIDDAPKRTIEDLLIAVNNTSFFLARNFAADSYIPQHAQHKTRDL